jgi:cullin-4
LTIHGEYNSVFESFYLEVTRSFYVAESLECAQALKHRASEFFEHINSRMDEETQRSQDVLLVGSYGIVTEVTENAMLGGRLEWLAKEGVLNVCLLSADN